MMAKKSYDCLLKILLIGDSGCSKTQILFNHCCPPPETSSILTVGVDFQIKQVNVEGKVIMLQIWDTAGQERFHTTTIFYCRGAHGIVLVYDVANAKSFENVSFWLRNIKEHGPSEVEILVMANSGNDEAKTIVSYEQGKRFAEDEGLMFVEVNPQSDDTVDQGFNILVEKLIRKAIAKVQELEETATDKQTKKESCLIS